MSPRWATTRRAAAIVRALAVHGWAHAVARLARDRPGLLRLSSRAAEPAPERLRALFEELGGSFVKFGQMLALQPDLLPIEFCDALLRLLDRIEPFEYAVVEQIIREELGDSPHELFDDFDETPLATASVGQVHVAWLDGVKVAVKVQRPAARPEFGNDVRLMVATLKVIRGLRLTRLNWLLEPMGEFIQWTREELDYRYEADYADRLRELGAGNAAQRVPEVFRSHSTDRVLVAEFLEGITLLDYLRAREENDEPVLERLEEMRFNSALFATHVIDNFLGDAFNHGIYHADLHPANLMILDDSVVGYIDFGITGVMSQHARNHLMRMTLGLAMGDHQSMFREYLEITVHDDDSDYPGLRRGLERAAATWYGDQSGGSLSANFTQIMSEMLALSRENRVMPERDVIKYIRSSIAIDGLVTRFVPDFDLGRHLALSCARHLREQMRGEHLRATRWADLTSSNRQLMQDGLARGVASLERLLDGRSVPGTSAGSSGERSTGWRLPTLGAAALGSALLALTAPPAPAGPNLATAQLLFAGLALACLVRAVLSGPRRQGERR